MMLKVFLTIGLLQVLTMAVQLVRTKVLALLLGPQALGVMAVIDKLLAVIVQTVSLSMPFAALRFLPSLWTSDPAAFRERFVRMRNVVLLGAGAALAVSVLVTLVRPVTWGAQLLPYRGVVLCAVLGIPMLALLPVTQSAVAGRLESNRAMLVALGQAGAMALAAAAIPWRGLAGYYLLYGVLGLGLAILASRLVLRGIPGAATGFRFPLALPRLMWRFSGALLAVAFVAPYAALFVHYKVLSDHGAEAAGWMQAAMGLGLAVRGVLGSAHSVFLTPNVNRSGTPADRMAWANAFQATFCFLAAAALPPLLLFPQLFVRALYSSAFLPGAAFAVVFILNEMATLLAGTYQTLILALDQIGFHVLQNVASQVLMIGVAAVLIAPLGILGAGLAVLAGPVCIYLATTTFLRRKYGLRIPRRERSLMGLLVLVIVGCGTLGALRPELTAGTVVAKLAAYAAVAGGFALLLSAEERERVRGMVAAVRARLAPAAG